MSIWRDTKNLKHSNATLQQTLSFLSRLWRQGENDDCLIMAKSIDVPLTWLELLLFHVTQVRAQPNIPLYLTFSLRFIELTWQAEQRLCIDFQKEMAFIDLMCTMRYQVLSNVVEFPCDRRLGEEAWAWASLSKVKLMLPGEWAGKAPLRCYLWIVSCECIYF